MATTTNYGFVTPDDTALVKDGAAAIRTLGSAVDTTTKNLNPETTLGDLSFLSSTANVKTRIGIGTAGQNLTVVAGVPAWATPAAGGGMTLISTTTLSGTSTTISGIAGTFKSLVGYIFGLNLSGSDYPLIKPNGTNNTKWSGICETTNDQAGNDWFLTTGTLACQGSNTANAWTFYIDNYANTTNFKPVHWYGVFPSSSASKSMFAAGAFKSNTAITSIEINTNSGTTTYSAGTVLLYGVN